MVRPCPGCWQRSWNNLHRRLHEHWRRSWPAAVARRPAPCCTTARHCAPANSTASSISMCCSTTCGAWPGSLAGALANRLLPPNVGYVECAARGTDAARQVRDHEHARSSRDGSPRSSLDTTMWARFCQPAVLRMVALRRGPRRSASSWIGQRRGLRGRLGGAAGSSAGHGRGILARAVCAHLRGRTARGEDRPCAGHRRQGAGALRGAAAAGLGSRRHPLSQRQRWRD